LETPLARRGIDSPSGQTVPFRSFGHTPPATAGFRFAADTIDCFIARYNRNSAHLGAWFLSVPRTELLAAGDPQANPSALLIEDKHGSGTTYEDAVTLARYARLIAETNEYIDFIKEAMA
jgi:hypothetical protein